MKRRRPQQDLQKALAARDKMRAAGAEVETWGFLRGQT
jgi:hypothetical protein